MHIIRPIQEKDLDIYEEFAKKASLGLINLPKKREILKEKIQLSEKAFRARINRPDLENYIFVLENLETHELEGTCGICSRMGVIEPHYYFRIETIYNDYTKKEMQILSPVSYPIGPTEILALYLRAKLRKEGLGKLLSFCRFLFIASHRERFEDYVVAEMRGFIKEDNTVPFWNSLCRHFLDIDYAELCDRELESRSFIPYLLPKWPLYVDFLPEETKKYIAKTHEKTVPALKMLTQQGFSFTGEIDPFDGGPKLGCRTDDIECIKKSQTAILDSLDLDQKNERSYIISNTLLDFRACYGGLKIIKPGLISLSKEVAQALKVNLGDEIRFFKLMTNQDLP